MWLVVHALQYLQDGNQDFEMDMPKQERLITLMCMSQALGAGAAEEWDS